MLPSIVQGNLINKLVRLELFSPSERYSLADRLVLIDPTDGEFLAAPNLFDAHLDRVRAYSAADRDAHAAEPLNLALVFS